MIGARGVPSGLAGGVFQRTNTVSIVAPAAGVTVAATVSEVVSAVKLSLGTGESNVTVAKLGATVTAGRTVTTSSSVVVPASFVAVSMRLKLPPTALTLGVKVNVPVLARFVVSTLSVGRAPSPIMKSWSGCSSP